MGWEATTAIILTALAFVGTLANIMAQRRKTNADAADSIASAADKLVHNLQDRIDRQQERISALEAAEAESKRKFAEVTRSNAELSKEVCELRAGVTLLCNQVEHLGGRPVWRPVEAAR